MLSSRLLCLGLGAAALFSLSAATPAQAGAGTNYNYHVTFTTPNQFLSYTTGDIVFLFNPEASGAPASSITGSNLTYSNDWQVNPLGISTVGVTSVDYFAGSVTIGNADTINGFMLPVSQWGTQFAFDVNYQGPARPDPVRLHRRAAIRDNRLLAVRRPVQPRRRGSAEKRRTGRHDHLAAGHPCAVARAGSLHNPFPRPPAGPRAGWSGGHGEEEISGRSPSNPLS